jgi:serine/threonine protein kinase
VSVNTRVGTEVAGYRLEKVVGRGGMSCVYLAEHIRLGRKVALKILASALSEDEGYRERFVRESRRAAELEHPNIIPIYDAGEDDGELYIAMRYVEGADLKAIIKRDGPLRLGHVLFILEQVADALDAAHERDLVHRDVKPSNILVSEPSDRVYLTDFGVVKHTASRGLTKTGFFIGTVDYAPPEQIEGLPLDSRTDVYALGCVFYECLTGRAPYDRDGEVAVMHAHLTASPPKLTVSRPDLPKALNEVVATAMAKSKEERYASCGDMMVAAREAALQRPTTMRRQLQDLEAQGAVPLVDPSAGPPPAADPTVLPEPVAASEAPVSQVSAEAPVQAPAPPQPPPGDTAVPVTPPTQGGPDQPSRSRFWRSPWIVTAVLVIAAAVVSGIGVYFATKNDSNNSAITNTTPNTTPTVPGPATTPKGLEGVTFASLWRDCAVENAPRAGAVQTALCTPHAASPKNFPNSVELSLYPDTTSLLAAFAEIKASDPQSAKLVEGKGRCDGAGWNGDGQWLHGDGAKGGHRFCFFDQSENAVVVWTHERAPAGGQPQTNHLDTLGIAKFSGRNNTTLSNWWKFWHPLIGKCPDQGCVARLP